MRKWMLEILVCPRCKGKFKINRAKEENREIKSGILKCQQCSQTFPIENYIPRFSKDSYALSFGFEWNTFKRVQLDSVNGTGESHRTFYEKTGLSEKELTGKLVLEAGCGSGRFLEIAAKNASRVIGVDISRAVDASRENLSHLPNVEIVQADIFSLPFTDTFDIVYSIGVLHHTPNTKGAFEAIARHVKPGGRVSVWVYPYIPIHSELSNLIRRYTIKIPQEELLDKIRGFTKGPGNVSYQISRIPIIGHIIRILPLSFHPGGEDWRVLDNFDWFAPQYQWKHTNREVKGWFRENGFERIKVLPPKVAVTGRRKL